MKLGLFGNPVSHSKSPAIFSSLCAELGRKISYEAVLVNDFSGAVAKARAAGWRGASVTIPFKLDAAKAAKRLTHDAKAIGAVNALKFGKTIIGHNTDAAGLMDAFKFADVVMSGVRVLVFGAGGAARAAGYAAAKSGAQSVHFTNRTFSTATKCARDLAAYFPRTRFSAGAARNADVWINALPLGLKGCPDKSPAPKALRPPKAAVDLVYGRRTAFQRQTTRTGARTIDGTAMLVFQALRAYEFWDRPLGPARRALLAGRIIKELS